MQNNWFGFIDCNCPKYRGFLHPGALTILSRALDLNRWFSGVLFYGVGLLIHCLYISVTIFDSIYISLYLCLFLLRVNETANNFPIFQTIAIDLKVSLYDILILCATAVGKNIHNFIHRTYRPILYVIEVIGLYKHQSAFWWIFEYANWRTVLFVYQVWCRQNYSS